MEAAIRRIIESIPSNHIFDSHYIIQQLVKTETHVFYDFIRGKFNADVHAVHGLLAQEIDKLVNVTKLDNLSYSENIKGNPSACTAWVKR